MSDDKGSDDMTSNAERKLKSDASPGQWSFAAEAWLEVTYGILSPTF